MSIDFNTPVDRQGTDSIKWFFFDPDVLPLWVADMDFISPTAVMDALEKRVRHGIFGYPGHSKELVDAVVQWVKDRHGWVISPDQVLILPSIISGFNLAARAFSAGRSILMHTPAYPPFFQVAPHAGVNQSVNPLQPTTAQYEIDFDDFRKKAALEAGLFLLCNPQNPTGRVFTTPELEQMAEICLSNQMMICSDEIHSDLVYTGQRHIPIASLSPEVASKTITLIAPSKTFNLAGLHTAFAIIPSAEVRKKFLEADPGLMGSANLLGMIAAEAAYRQGKPWLDELLVYLESNRDYLINFIRRELPGISVFAPQGTYLAWLDCRALKLPMPTPFEFFLKEARVGLNRGADFGVQGTNFVRINFGCPRSILVEALTRMKNKLHNLGI